MAIEKRKRGQNIYLLTKKLLNTAISTLRQPIESYFNWLIELTSIQDASKVRATKACLTHVYGKIAAASVF
jgi:hypothetical protein